MELKHMTLTAVDPVTGEEGPGKIHICKRIQVDSDDPDNPYDPEFCAKPLCGRYAYVSDDGGWPVPWDEFIDEKVTPTDVVCKTCARLAEKYRK